MKVQMKAQAKQNEQIIAFTASALRILSERAVNAALAFFGLGGALFLWQKVLADPNPAQLGGLGLFAAFVIGILYTRRDK